MAAAKTAGIYTTDDLELIFEEMLTVSTVDALYKVCAKFGVEERHWKGKNKIYAMKALRRETDKDEEEEKRKILTEIVSVLSAEQPQAESETDVQIENTVFGGVEGELDHQQQGEEATLAAASQQDILRQQREGREEEIARQMQMWRIKREVVTKPRRSHPLQSIDDVLASSASVLRKDFRIVGQIGEAKQTDKLSFVSLCRQVEGSHKGYEESEIINGILKAIGPKSLRTYLEISENLTLKKLMEILRNHYKEKPSTELYQDLINLKQHADEDATQFVIRALEVREKVIFASKEEGSIRYDSEQVQSLFISTIESGINDEICTKIRPYLKKDTSDIELINQVNMADASIKTRRQKSQLLKPAVKQNARMSAVETSCDANFLNQMTDLTNVVKDLQKQVEELKQNRKGFSRKGESSRCEDCVRNNQRVCSHCFKCGSTSHIARYCSKKDAGNGRRLLPGGHQ